MLKTVSIQYNIAQQGKNLLGDVTMEAVVSGQLVSKKFNWVAHNKQELFDFVIDPIKKLKFDTNIEVRSNKKFIEVLINTAIQRKLFNSFNHSIVKFQLEETPQQNQTILLNPLNIFEKNIENSLDLFQMYLYCSRYPESTTEEDPLYQKMVKEGFIPKDMSIEDAFLVIEKILEKKKIL